MGTHSRLGLVFPAEQERIEPSPSRGIVHAKERILVVETNDLVLDLLQRWLGEAGYAVVVARSQRLPWAYGARGKPHLVIIDVPTPRNAEEVITSVRKAYAGPILLLSARFRQGTDSSSDVPRQLGVRKVLPKPFTRDELLSAVQESIDGQ
jgi:DNA-binding response OmpR family regulator